MYQNLIYIVDDNDEFRDSTSWVLEGEGYTVMQFEDPIIALDKIKKNKQNTNCCCLLDIRMPNMTGLEFHDHLIKHKVEIPIIYMTGHGDVPLAVEAMSKGAITFLEKPIDHNVLNTAIDTALKSPANHLYDAEFNDSDSKIQEYNERINSLTNREYEILNEIVAGKMNKVIAVDLGISVKTVELHRSRVMTKMNAKTAADLVKMVLTKAC
jgi:two-component system response regulator FixJ